MRAHPLKVTVELFFVIFINYNTTNIYKSDRSRVASIYYYSSRRTATHPIDRAYVKNWYFALNALRLNVSQVPGDISQPKLSIASDA